MSKNNENIGKTNGLRPAIPMSESNEDTKKTNASRSTPKKSSGCTACDAKGLMLCCCAGGGGGPDSADNSDDNQKKSMAASDNNFEASVKPKNTERADSAMFASTVLINRVVAFFSSDLEATPKPKPGAGKTNKKALDDLKRIDAAPEIANGEPQADTESSIKNKNDKPGAGKSSIKSPFALPRYTPPGFKEKT